MGEIVLEVNQVVKQYPDARVPSIDGLSFAITKGAIFGIFGSNGAGKTTLISLLCGLLEPNSGTINYTLDGQQLSARKTRSYIGFVPQDFSFYPELSAANNLAFFGAQYGVSRELLEPKIETLLRRVGLYDVRNNKVSSYSGGMKRRLNLIIALLHDPKIVFLDEPTVGVDVQSKLAIMELLRELNATGTTILYTSHHLKEAEDFCTTLLLLDHGRIIANNTLPELLATHKVDDLEALLLKLTGNVLRD